MSDDLYLHPLFLPPHPHLDQYKKLAKDFQHACKLADPGAIRQWAERSKEAVARLRGLDITHDFAHRGSTSRGKHSAIEKLIEPSRTGNHPRMVT